MVFLLDSLEAAGEAVAPEIESAVGGEIRSVASEAAGDIYRRCSGRCRSGRRRCSKRRR